MVKADLASTLGSVEPATIFAPTNEAFDAVPQDTLNALLADTELLKNVLLYHVIPNVAIQSSQLKADQSVETANGAPLRVNVFPKYETVVTVNGIPVVKADVPAGSGSVVHVVEKVILPIKAGDNVAAVVSSDPQFSTLLAAVQAAGLADALATTGESFRARTHFTNIGKIQINILKINNGTFPRQIRCECVGCVIKSYV